MKVSYMNDEQKPVTVRIQDARYDPFTGTGDTFVVLQAAELKIFEVYLPENTSLYIKKWPELVMISYISEDSLCQLEQSQQSEEGA